MLRTRVGIGFNARLRCVVSSGRDDVCVRDDDAFAVCVLASRLPAGTELAITNRRVRKVLCVDRGEPWLL